MALEAAIEMFEGVNGDRTAVVTLTGMMTLGTNLKTADQQVQTALSQGAKNMILDLTGVEYSDSAGLGMMMHTFGLVRAKGGALRLCGVGPRVRAMLQLTTTEKILVADADRAGSLAALNATTRV